MKILLIPTIALCALAAVVLEAQSPMRPGRWEVTVQMQMANMKMPPTKNASCITAAQLEKDPASWASSGPSNQCKVSDFKVVDSVATWKIACTGQMAMTGDGKVTFMGDTYSGTMKMAAPQGEMSMQLDGKRLGDCMP